MIPLLVEGDGDLIYRVFTVYGLWRVLLPRGVCSVRNLLILLSMLGIGMCIKCGFLNLLHLYVCLLLDIHRFDRFRMCE